LRKADVSVTACQWWAMIGALDIDAILASLTTIRMGRGVKHSSKTSAIQRVSLFDRDPLDRQHGRSLRIACYQAGMMLTRDFAFNPIPNHTVVSEGQTGLSPTIWRQLVITGTKLSYEATLSNVAKNDEAT
jgi:hypothetical protein